MTDPIMSARLASRIESLCAALLAIDEDTMRPAVEEVRRTAAAPLRLAVTGRVKAGKSTLVNALLGRDVAATSAEECTRVVTEYRWGANAHAVVVLDDGTRMPLPFSGRLPDELPWPAERVASAEVYLPESPLRDFALIDTPGLSTTTEANERATRRAVLPGDGRAGVDALLYVFRDVERSDDIEFLRTFRRATGESAVPSLGVLSHADAFGADREPLTAARAYASEIAARRNAELGQVIALSGKMAEAATTGRLRETDARLLAALADVPDDDVDVRLLPSSVDDRDVDDLADRIGDYALLRSRVVARGGAAAVTDWLLASSGLEELTRALRDRSFGRHVHLRTAQALDLLERASAGSPRSDVLATELHRARAHADLHPLQEQAARSALAETDPTAPAVEQLDRLLDAEDDRERLGLPHSARSVELQEAAARLSTAANAAANLALPGREADAYRTIARSYALLLLRAR